MVADDKINNGSSMHSNLDRFLDFTTPLVSSQFLPKSEIRNLNRLWHPWQRETVEYFTLGSLWDSYDEWSVYGAGVPIDLGDGETLVQYYVPYLSAIQIFTSTPSPHHSYNNSSGGRELDTDSRDGETRYSCSSESCSSESESEKLSYRWDGSSSSEEGAASWSEHDSPWQHQVNNDRLGHLYCHYFERSTPYGRAPLRDKISGLARRYPGLMSLRSVDLSPASWMAVAWYPIYHIPMGRTIKDLSTCFLTYHTLSSSFQDMDVEDDLSEGMTTTTTLLRRKKMMKEGGGGGGVGEAIPLPAFGLATYKMQGNMWTSGRRGQDQDRLASFRGVADSWLKQLRVQHPDFNFFMGIRRG